MKKLYNASFVRFLFSGAVNTVCGYLLYVVLLYFFDYRVAFSISFAASVIVSYLLNAAFVFRIGLSLRGFLRFPLIYASQYLVSLLLLTVEVEHLDVPEKLAPLINVAVLVPFTYILTKWVLTDGNLNATR